MFCAANGVEFGWEEETVKPKTADRPIVTNAPQEMRRGKRRTRAKARCDDNRLFCKGRRVITEAEMAERDCPFPPEPEWAEEWAKWEVE